MVSVIVPIYNTAEYLEKGIDSILGQTHKELEVVLVDDGSTDISGQICDKYSELDKRVTVIHKKNEGLVSARKAGLEAASGDFIVWVDSDDWIESDWIERLLNEQKRTKADVVVADLYFDVGQDSQVVRNGIDYGLYDIGEVCNKLLYNGSFYDYGVNPHLVTKLWKRELIYSIQMDVDNKIVVGEDAAVTYPAILSARNILVTDICCYHYVQHPGAMTKTVIQNEIIRQSLLFKHLEKYFVLNDIQDDFNKQLLQYKKYLAILRTPQIFDKCDGKCLMPYGGIPNSSRIILYGAGGVGQSLYRYIQTRKEINLIDWVDKNYKMYRQFNLDVNNPKHLKEMEKNADYILIANISQKTANFIRGYLENLGIDKNKILWFSEDFLTEDYEKQSEK